MKKTALILFPIICLFFNLKAQKNNLCVDFGFNNRDVMSTNLKIKFAPVYSISYSHVIFDNFSTGVKFIHSDKENWIDNITFQKIQLYSFSIPFSYDINLHKKTMLQLSLAPSIIFNDFYRFYFYDDNTEILWGEPKNFAINSELKLIKLFKNNTFINLSINYQKTYSKINNWKSTQYGSSLGFGVKF